jgi:hypothetical protein
MHAGVAQLVELQPSKLVVEGSSPFARSNESTQDTTQTHPSSFFRPRSTVAVHFLGKEGVASSILAEGSAT